MKRLNVLFLLLLMLTLCCMSMGMLSCSHTLTPGEMNDLAYGAAQERDYDQAETVWLQVARGLDADAYEARKYLTRLYDHRAAGKSGGYWGAKGNPNKELYWLLQLVDHPLHFKKETGLYEEQIAWFFKTGVGTSSDLNHACVWYEKAYMLGRREVAKELAENCSSRTKFPELRDAVFVAWVTQYPEECPAGRRAKLPHCLGKGCTQACDGPSMTLAEFRSTWDGISKGSPVAELDDSPEAQAQREREARAEEEAERQYQDTLRQLQDVSRRDRQALTEAVGQTLGIIGSELMRHNSSPAAPSYNGSESVGRNGEGCQVRINMSEMNAYSKRGYKEFVCGGGSCLATCPAETEARERERDRRDRELSNRPRANGRSTR